MFIISFSLHLFIYMNSRPSETLAYHLLPTSCPEVEDIGFIPYIIYRVVSLKLT